MQLRTDHIARFYLGCIFKNDARRKFFRYAEPSRKDAERIQVVEPRSKSSEKRPVPTQVVPEPCGKPAGQFINPLRILLQYPSRIGEQPREFT